jgi:hypothetical protein
MISTLGWQMPLWLQAIYFTTGVEKIKLSHDDAYYSVTIDEMSPPPNGDDAIKTILPMLGSLLVAAEE